MQTEDTMQTEDIGKEQKPQILRIFSDRIEAPLPEILEPTEEPKQPKVNVNKHGNILMNAPEATFDGYVAGVYNNRPRKKPTTISMTKPTLYPIHKQDGELTDYANDLENIQAGLKAISAGSSVDDVYKDNMRLRAQTYKHLVDVKGADPQETATNLGMDFEMIQATNDAWERYKMALDSDVSQIGSGFIKLGTMTPLSTERDKVYAQEIHKETEAIVQRDKDSQAMYEAFNDEYNEKTGSLDSPWNLSAMAGNSTVDMAMGGTAAVMAKGSTATIRALREAYMNVGGATIKESLKYGHHGDEIEAGTGIMSALAGEAVGGMLAKTVKPTRNEGIKTKDVTGLNDILDGLHILKKYNIDIGEEDLMEPEEVLAKIKSRNHNSSELERLTAIYTKRNMALIKGLRKSLASMGITDASQLKAYSNGEIPLDQMGPEFKEFIGAKMDEHTARMAPVYESLQTLDVDKTTGNQTRYNIVDLLENIKASSSGGKSIYRDVMAEVRHHLVSMESTASKQAKELDNKLKQDIKASSEKLIGVNNAINKVDDSILNASNRLDLANERLSELDPTYTGSKRTALNMEKDKAIKDLAKHTKARRSLKAKRRETSKKINKDKKTKKENRNAVNKANDPEFATIMQVNEVRKHLNGLINGSVEAMFSIKDKKHIKVMERMVRDIDDWYGEIPSDNGKFLISRLRYANSLAKEGFDKWGDGAFKGVQKMMDNDNPDMMSELFSGKRARFHLENLGKLFGKDSELYIKASSKFLFDKIMKGVESPTGVKASADIDWEILSNNLKDPEVQSLIKDLVGKDALKEINGMAYLGGTVGKHINEAFKSLAHTQAQKKGLIRSIYDGTMGDLFSTLMAGLEKYSGHTLKTKFYGGKSSKSRIKSVLDNRVADLIEVVSGKTILGIVPNTRYSTNEAIAEIEKELVRRQGNPNAVIEYVKSLAKSAKDLARRVNENWQGAHIGYAGSSSTLGKPDGKFDLRNISPKDREFMGRLKSGDTVTDYYGNTFKKSTKRKMVPAEVGSKEPIPLREATEIQKSDPENVFLRPDGKHFKFDEETKWEPVTHTKQGTLTVDSSNEATEGMDFTKPTDSKYLQEVITPTEVPHHVFANVRSESINTNEFLANLEKAGHSPQFLADNKEMLQDYYNLAHQVSVVENRKDLMRRTVYNTVEDKDSYVLDNVQEEIVAKAVLNTITTGESLTEYGINNGMDSGLMGVAYSVLEKAEGQFNEGVLARFPDSMRKLANNKALLDQQENAVKKRLAENTTSWEKTSQFVDPYKESSKYKEAFNDMTGEVAPLDDTAAQAVDTLDQALKGSGNRFGRRAENLENTKFLLTKGGMPKEKVDNVISKMEFANELEEKRMKVRIERDQLMGRHGKYQTLQEVYNEFEYRWTDYNVDAGKIRETIRSGSETVGYWANKLKDPNYSNEESIVQAIRDIEQLMRDTEIVEVAQGSPIYKGLTKKYKDLYEAKQEVLEDISDMIGDERNKARAIADELSGVSSSNPGSATMASPMDDAVYNARLKNDTKPRTKDGWLNYFKQEGVPDDELEASGVLWKLDRFDGQDISLEEMERMMAKDKRHDTIREIDHGDFHMDTSMNDRPLENYKETGKYTEEYLHTPGEFQDKLVYNSQSHYRRSGSARGEENMVSHMRESDYVNGKGQKVLRIMETQADGYQRIPSKSFKSYDDYYSSIEAGKKSINDMSDPESGQEMYIDMYTAIKGDLEAKNGHKPDFESLLEKLTETFMSSKIVDVDSIMKVNEMPQARQVLEDMIGETIHIGKSSRDDVAMANTWWQKSYAHDLVKAYNKGYRVVEVPIGELGGKVEEDMVRTEGVTTWLRHNVMPYLEKIGANIDAKNVSYDPQTEMLQIELPEKPFTITHRGNKPKG